MIPCKPIGQRLTILFLYLFIFSAVNTSAQDGKVLFMSNCASCHKVDRKLTGPALAGLEDRGKWADHNELLKWINNPSAYMANDSYTQGLKTEYGSMMTAFPALTLKDVDAIVTYINAEADLFGNLKTKSALSKFTSNVFRHLAFGGEMLIGKTESFALRLGYNHLRRMEVNINDYSLFGGLSFGFVLGRGVGLIVGRPEGDCEGNEVVGFIDGESEGVVVVGDLEGNP